MAPEPRVSAFVVGVAVVVWLGLAALVVVPSPLSPSRNPLALWLVILGVCGAFAHALLLLSGRFRALGYLGRIVVLWLAVTFLLAAVRFGAGPLGSPSSVSGLLFAGTLFAIVPAVAACAVATWWVERAEA